MRLPKVGKYKDIPNEWDSALFDVGDDNSIWHWHGIYTWGCDKTDDDDYPGYWALRGYDTPWTWTKYEPDYSLMVVIGAGSGAQFQWNPTRGSLDRNVSVWYGQQIICGLLDLVHGI